MYMEHVFFTNIPVHEHFVLMYFKDLVSLHLKEASYVDLIMITLYYIYYCLFMSSNLMFLFNLVLT